MNEVNRKFNELFSHDLSLSSIEEQNHLLCVGSITSLHKRYTDALFMQISTNCLADMHVLYKEDEAFIGIAKNENTLYLFTNRDILSPSLFSKSMALLFYYIDFLFSEDEYFVFESLDFRISSFDKIEFIENSSLKVEYEENEKCIHFIQKEKEDVFSFFSKICNYVVDLALPVSIIGAEEISSKYLVPFSYLEERIYFYKTLGMQITFPIIVPYIYNEEEYVVGFKEVLKSENHYEFVPLVEVSEEGFLVPTQDQIRLTLSSMEFLQQKIYLKILKNIGPFYPVSYGNLNNTFFSRDIVIQIGRFLAKDKYFDQDNLILLSNVLDYFLSLGSRNMEKAFIHEIEKK